MLTSTVLSRLCPRMPPLALKLNKTTLSPELSLFKTTYSQVSASARRISRTSGLPLEMSSLGSMMPLHSAVASARLRSQLSTESQNLGFISQDAFDSASHASMRKNMRSQIHTLDINSQVGIMALSRVRIPSLTIFNRVIPKIRSFSTTSYNAFDSASHASMRENMMSQIHTLDINSQVGSCMPLASMRIGTMIHNIEMNPGQGGKLVRAAGTSAKILKEPTSRYVLVRLPSGAEKLFDTRCRATIGQVSNPSHGARKLRKAGQSRWLGRRPVVRGVAMNPVDHPHGGGEGRSKSSGSRGRTSVTPWGKPCKSGYKTGPLKRKK